MKKNQNVLIGIGILVILAITIILIKGYPFKQDYESCIKTCENTDDSWYFDINCTEYCRCIAEESYLDVCADFRVGKPNISDKVKITTEKAVEIAKATSEVQEFLKSGEASNVSGVLEWVPYNCVQKVCDYKYVVDYSYDISGRVISPWSKELGLVVIIEIDASTGEIIGRYSKLKDTENFKENCTRIYRSSSVCE